MYARYDDVSALDYLEAQVDLEYRLTWDDHAVKLYTIDSETSTRSDVIYWETKWPVCNCTFIICNFKFIYDDILFAAVCMNFLVPSCQHMD